MPTQANRYHAFYMQNDIVPITKDLHGALSANNIKHQWQHGGHHAKAPPEQPPVAWPVPWISRQSWFMYQQTVMNSWFMRYAIYRRDASVKPNGKRQWFYTTMQHYKILYWVYFHCYVQNIYFTNKFDRIRGGKPVGLDNLSKRAAVHTKLYALHTITDHALCTSP